MGLATAIVATSLQHHWTLSSSGIGLGCTALPASMPAYDCRKPCVGMRRHCPPLLHDMNNLALLLADHLQARLHAARVAMAAGSHSNPGNLIAALQLPKHNPKWDISTVLAFLPGTLPGSEVRSSNINRADEQGRTLLHHAAFHGRMQTVQLLLACGAAADVRDCFGLTPLCMAVLGGAHGCAEVCRKLKRACTPALQGAWPGSHHCAAPCNYSSSSACSYSA